MQMIGPTVYCWPHCYSAMRRMLKICEEYAGNLSVIFNASKSKCVVCQSRQRVKTTGITAVFSLLSTVRPLRL